MFKKIDYSIYRISTSSTIDKYEITLTRKPLVVSTRYPCAEYGKLNCICNADYTFANVSHRYVRSFWGAN